ncbi:MAG: EamA family transporter [Gammaproteobacteria bacterium]|nr:EamA family transporter [Gammaproteobacteria bacterium]
MKKTTNGWLSGLLGVVIFSGSLPATRVAVQTLDPLFLTFARAVIAGTLALGLLLAFGEVRPARRDVVPLVVVALSVVVGFPLLSALALRHVTSAHAIVFIGLLPVATAIFGVLRGGERPQPAFWLFAFIGSAAVIGYAMRNGIDASPGSDALMLGAIAACGLGYAEGARLSRHLGGWQVISWALVVALPITLPLAWWARPATFEGVSHAALWALAYVSLFSMLIGFVFWYRGLALGGIAGVGQLQLLQPLVGLMLAAALLHERVPGAMLLVTMVVLACVAGARRFSRSASLPRAG